MTRRPAVGVPLDVARLSEGLNRLEQRVGSADLGLEWPEVRFSKVFKLHLEVVRMGHDLQIDGRFSGSISAACDRCLRDFDAELGGKFRALGRLGDAATHELGQQDGVVFHDGHALDLTGEVRQAILLEVPIQHLCAADCRGFCATCGADLNRGRCSCTAQEVDPRWAALARLRSDQRIG